MNAEIIRIDTEAKAVKFKLGTVENWLPIEWCASIGWHIVGNVRAPEYVQTPVNDALRRYDKKGQKADDVITVDEPEPKHSGSKYLRYIQTDAEGRVDVYAVLEAFNVTCPARQHAIKKLLCSGLRGKGSTEQDLSEARDAITRGLELL